MSVANFKIKLPHYLYNLCMHLWLYVLCVAPGCGSQSQYEAVCWFVGTDLFIISNTNCRGATGCVSALCQTWWGHLYSFVSESFSFSHSHMSICLQLVIFLLNNCFPIDYPNLLHPFKYNIIEYKKYIFLFSTAQKCTIPVSGEQENNAQAKLDRGYCSTLKGE